VREDRTGPHSKFTSELHVGVAAAHIFVEGGLGEGQGFGELFFIREAQAHERLSRDGELGVLLQMDEAVLGDGIHVVLQLFHRGVEILRIAGIEQPYGTSAAQNAGEPEDLGGEVVLPLIVCGVVEDELALLAGVVARGDGDGLAVAALDEFDLSLVHDLANGVVDEGFCEGLLGSGDDVREGDGHGRRDLRAKLRVGGGVAVFEEGVAVDDVGVCA